MDIRDMTYEEVLELAYTGREPIEPGCRGFKWIGQPFTSCDGCGRPVWEHEGMSRLRPNVSPFDKNPWHVVPFRPGEAESWRARWGPLEETS